MSFSEIKDKFFRIESFVKLAEGAKLFNLAKRCSKGSIVEIGSFKGRSTICLGKGSQEGFQKKVYAIDPHYFLPVGSSFIELKKNISDMELDSLVTAVNKTSEEASKAFEEPIGLIFIDGDHSYDMVKLDIELWFSKIADGGIVAFHDVASWWSGVRRAVKEKIINSDECSEAGFAKQLFYVKKVNKNNSWDKFRNKMVFYICVILGTLDHYVFSELIRFVLKVTKVFGYKSRKEINKKTTE